MVGGEPKRPSRRDVRVWTTARGGGDGVECLRTTTTVGWRWRGRWKNCVFDRRSEVQAPLVPLRGPRVVGCTWIIGKTAVLHEDFFVSCWYYQAIKTPLWRCTRSLGSNTFAVGILKEIDKNSSWANVWSIMMVLVSCARQ